MRTSKGAWAMTAWIVSIARKFPQHLQYSMEKGFWDMKKPADVKRGDNLYFRLSGASLVGMCIATSDTYLANPDGTPLEDQHPRWDGGGPYLARVDIDPVSVTSVREPDYKEILVEAGWAETYVMGFTRVLPVKSDSGDEFFRSCFFHGSVLDVTLPSSTGVLYTGAPPTRKTIEVVSREGQDRFKQKLLAAYNGACALSGSTIEAALDGAHIIEHSDSGVNECWNGILLRADVHRLFDRSLIRIGANGRVEIDSSLAGTEYEKMTSLQRPSKREDRPLSSALEHRWTVKNGRDIADF
ncbi:HNH endonuclease [Tsukamurella pulmonis]|nr:HNH endonuclease [Tsukamurella pulmonis]